MTTALLGRKIGMTRYFTEEGKNVPVTVIQAGPCFVTQVKNKDAHGYSAIQIGFEDVEAGRTTMPLIGHDAKAGVSPKKFHREVRLEDDGKDFAPGQELTVEVFAETKFVDVIGISKGKGFQGTMKRHNFKGLTASHGTERKHRSPGSIAGHATNRGTGPKPKKGKRMAGQMGNEQVTVRNLDVIEVLSEKSILLVKGAVPGPNGGLLFVRTSTRLGRSKQLAASSKKK
ncbi:MAG: 50S ribosomal protein L3 [Phycisphaerales bacterium]|nr:50S ribosomal protein L3 [Phycisphaerales bacterium]